MTRPGRVANCIPLVTTALRMLMAGDILVGVALAVLATKPQAMGLHVVLLGLWAISRRRWAIPVSAVGCAIHTERLKAVLV